MYVDNLPEECYEGEHAWTEPEEVDKEHHLWHRECKRCGEVEEDFLFVEYWPQKTMTIKGKKYRALKAWGNISLCSKCGKVIFDCPLILWDSKDTSKAVTFHIECAQKLNLFQ